MNYGDERQTDQVYQSWASSINACINRTSSFWELVATENDRSIKHLRYGSAFYTLVSIALVASEKPWTTEISDNLIKYLKHGLAFYVLVSIALAAPERLWTTEIDETLIESLKHGLAFDVLVSIAPASEEAVNHGGKRQIDFFSSKNMALLSICSCQSP